MIVDLPDEIPAGARCIECGYDLRGLRKRGVCPECGRLIRESLRPGQIRLSIPQLVRLRTAAHSATAACLLTLPAVASVVALLIYDTAILGATFALLALGVVVAYALAVTIVEDVALHHLPDVDWPPAWQRVGTIVAGLLFVLAMLMISGLGTLSPARCMGVIAVLLLLLGAARLAKFYSILALLEWRLGATPADVTVGERLGSVRRFIDSGLLVGACLSLLVAEPELSICFGCLTFVFLVAHLIVWVPIMTYHVGLSVRMARRAREAEHLTSSTPDQRGGAA